LPAISILLFHFSVKSDRLLERGAGQSCEL
jgi:hypothetical protein